MMRTLLRRILVSLSCTPTGDTLAQQIDGWMAAVQQDGKSQHARAIIAP